MNKKEMASFTGLVLGVFFLGFVFFSNMTTEVKVQMGSSAPTVVKIPAMFSADQTVVLVFLSAFSTYCGVFFFSGLSKDLDISKKQKMALNVLDGDARKLYEHILAKGECLQSELVYEMGFSKAKVSRILDTLDQKGLVKRISFGQTNKVIASD